MNAKNKKLMRFFAAAVMSANMLLSGCVTSVIPSEVPAQGGGRQEDLAGVILEVVSGSREPAPYKILTESGLNLGFTADRQVWSRKLADALAAELARRGARVRLNASLKLNVAVESVTLAQTEDTYRFNVKAGVSSTGGWTKEYDASAETTVGVFESVAGMSRRLAGQALANVVKTMAEDPDFLSRLGKR